MASVSSHLKSRILPNYNAWRYRGSIAIWRESGAESRDASLRFTPQRAGLRAPDGGIRGGYALPSEIRRAKGNSRREFEPGPDPGPFNSIARIPGGAGYAASLSAMASGT